MSGQPWWIEQIRDTRPVHTESMTVLPRTAPDVQAAERKRLVLIAIAVLVLVGLPVWALTIRSVAAERVEVRKQRCIAAYLDHLTGGNVELAVWTSPACAGLDETQLAEVQARTVVRRSIMVEEGVISS